MNPKKISHNRNKSDIVFSNEKEIQNFDFVKKLLNKYKNIDNENQIKKNEKENDDFITQKK